MLAWKIYYDDGSTFSSAQGAPHEAPALGVQMILQADPVVGRQVVTGKDFYYFDQGVWMSADWFGLWDYLCRPGAEKTVRFGRNMRSEAYHALMGRAAKDPELPPKSAWYPGEQRSE